MVWKNVISIRSLKIVLTFTVTILPSRFLVFNEIYAEHMPQKGFLPPILPMTDLHSEMRSRKPADSIGRMLQSIPTVYNSPTKSGISNTIAEDSRRENLAARSLPAIFSIGIQYPRKMRWSVQFVWYICVFITSWSCLLVFVSLNNEIIALQTKHSGSLFLIRH